MVDCNFGLVLSMIEYCLYTGLVLSRVDSTCGVVLYIYCRPNTTVLVMSMVYCTFGVVLSMDDCTVGQVLSMVYCLLV